MGTNILPPNGKEFPVLIYEYSREGYYGAPVRIFDAASLKVWMLANVSSIVKEKRELRITNVDDELVFHIEAGRLMFDGETVYPPPGKEIILVLREQGK